MADQHIGNSNQILTVNGTVSAPAYSWAGDGDSGWYRIGANNLGLTLNGAKVLDAATTGLSITGTLGVTGTLTGAAANFSGLLTFAGGAVNSNTAPASGSNLELLYSGGGVVQAYNRTGAAYTQLSIDGLTTLINTNSNGYVKLGTGALGIGMTPSNILDITKSQNAASIGRIFNGTSGTAGSAEWRASNDANDSIRLISINQSYTTSGLFAARKSVIASDGVGLAITTMSAQAMQFGINNTEVARFNTSGRLLVGGTYDAGASYSITTNAGVLALGSIVGGNGSVTIGASGGTDVTSNGWYTSGYGEHTAMYISNISYTYGGFGGFVNVSDARVKTVLADRINYRDAIANLFIGDFLQYKDIDKTSIPHAGFGVLAQQAHAVLGDFVGIQRPIDEDGLWSATQEPWAFVALKGVKSALSEIDQLRLDLAAALNRISTLETA